LVRCPAPVTHSWTVVEVAAEKNSTLVMPVPVELLRFFDRTAQAAAPRQPATIATGDADAMAPAAGSLAVPALAVPPSLAASPARNAPLNAAPKTPPTA